MDINLNNSYNKITLPETRVRDGNISCNTCDNSSNDFLIVLFCANNTSQVSAEVRKMRPSGTPQRVRAKQSLGLTPKEAKKGLCDGENSPFNPRNAAALNKSVRSAPNARTSESGD